MGTIFHLAMKDIKLLWRDKVGFFWVLGFPLLIALFFGSIYSGAGSTTARSMKIAVITDNITPAVQSFYDQLAKSEVLDIMSMPLDSARPLVAQGKLTAFVQYIDSSKSTFDIFSGKKPHIKVGIDPSRRAEAGYLSGLINQAYFMGLQSKFMDIKGWRGYLQNQKTSAITDDPQKPGLYGDYLSKLDDMLESVEKIDSAYAGSSDSAFDSTSGKDYSPFAALDIDFDDVAVARVGPRSSFEITFPQALQWALIAAAAAFSLSIVTERTRGTFLRLRIAPISRLQVLAGKGLACFIFCVGVCSLLMAIGILIFGVGVASWTNLILAIVAGGICFVGIMMLISVLGKTEAAVSGAGWAIMLVMSMLGGGMMPLMFMPSWLKSISHISPVKWSILALEGSIWRGFGIGEMILPLAVLVGVGVTGFVIGTMILSRSDG